MDRKVAQVMLVYIFVFFEDFSRLRILTKPKVVVYGRVVHITLFRHVFSAVVFPSRQWHAIIVLISLTLWSGQLPPQFM